MSSGPGGDPGRPTLPRGLAEQRSTCPVPGDRRRCDPLTSRGPSDGGGTPLQSTGRAIPLPTSRCVAPRGGVPSLRAPRDSRRPTAGGMSATKPCVRDEPLVAPPRPDRSARPADWLRASSNVRRRRSANRRLISKRCCAVGCKSPVKPTRVDQPAQHVHPSSCARRARRRTHPRRGRGRAGAVHERLSGSLQRGGARPGRWEGPGYRGGEVRGPRRLCLRAR